MERSEKESNLRLFGNGGYEIRKKIKTEESVGRLRDGKVKAMAQEVEYYQRAVGSTKRYCIECLVLHPYVVIYSALSIRRCSKGNPGTSGGGGCLRDHNGILVMAFRSFLGNCTNNFTERPTSKWASCATINEPKHKQQKSKF
ncbi:hypothetical protein RDI58_005844 [Solanum bulbocastanum]|uniref:Uncharacterized protein n=1 Tax=Solanum bulbocastanum TaxID=147425 RepID=A0AAN8U913_SOLBU